ncbi:GPCR-chaperone-domain-containing protein [Gorgonomyces haynaldii]|nr:GPCR-chaperone-domain-containing protein [Gorgonomyces haynaldii]
MAWERLVFQLIFEDKHQELDEIAAKADLKATHRGQTPLTLAVQLNRKECIKVLLKYCSTLDNNAQGWSPYQEATSLGQRDVMELLYRKRRQELGQWFNSKGKQLLDQISKDLDDFSLNMEWSFKSIIPFVAKLAPSDTYKIFKSAGSFRVDATLVGFEHLQWVRGNLSMIFNYQENRLVLLDHERKIVQQLWPKDFTLDDAAIEEEISVSLNTPIRSKVDVDWTSVRFTRAKSGYLWTSDRNEKVGNLDTRVWHLESADVLTYKRVEHLDCEPLPPQKVKEMINEEIAKQKLEDEKAKKKSQFVIANPDSDTDLAKKQAEEDAKFEKYRAGYRNIEESADADLQEFQDSRDAFNELAAFRDSLVLPEPVKMQLDEFMDPDVSDQYTHFGRPVNMKQKTQTLKATLWMYNGDPQVKSIQADDFPLKISNIVPILDLVGMGTNDHIRSLNEFFNVQLPNGFPVQVELPIGILPISGLIRFENIKMTKSDPALFDIPKEYREGEVVTTVHDY